MTHPDLDELVSRARRDRPAAGVLASVARNLRVPFVAVPLVAVTVTNTATATAVAKLGLSRLALLGWGSGAAAVSGVTAAVLLSQPAPPPPTLAPPPIVAPAPLAPPVAAPEQAAPEETPAPTSNVERRPAKDTPATWDEPQLIEKARKALASDPRRALSLAQEHQRRFPAGALSVEREVVVLEALARTGQTSEALRRARSFEQRYPQSIHLPRVRALRARLGDAP